MENAVKREPVPWGWKVGVFAPLLAAALLLLAARRQSDLHREIAFATLATLSVMASQIVISIYWIVVKRLTGWGIALLIFASAVVGFGLQTLLRVI